MIRIEELRVGDKVFILKNDETANDIKTLYVHSICPWDDYRETYSLELSEENSNTVVHFFEVHGCEFIEENVDDSVYTIATEKSLILEMLEEKNHKQ